MFQGLLPTRSTRYSCIQWGLVSLMPFGIFLYFSFSTKEVKSLLSLFMDMWVLSFILFCSHKLSFYEILNRTLESNKQNGKHFYLQGYILLILSHFIRQLQCAAIVAVFGMRHLHSSFSGRTFQYQWLRLETKVWKQWLVGGNRVSVDPLRYTMVKTNGIFTRHLNLILSVWIISKISIL